MALLFDASGWLVMPFWLLMIVAPRWRTTERVVRSPAIAVGPALLYAALVLPQLAALAPRLAHPTLVDVASLLGTPQGATIAWAHFLAFDLFVGRWVFLDARARGLSPWMISPLLVLTLLFGPLGLLGYLVLRSESPSRLLAAVRVFLAEGRRGSPALIAVALGAGALLGVSLVLQLIDERLVGGASTWLKPAKFGASILVTAPVLAWIIAKLRTPAGVGKGLRRAAGVFATTVVIELVLITVQAARAVPSHFNVGTLPDLLVFQIMGASITVFWMAQIWLTLRAFRHPFPDVAVGYGIRAGLLIATIGAGLAFTMTARVTPAQRAEIAAGHVRLAGGHSVGIEDGGRGLPGTRWSTEGGDLRVAHFVGLHALQVMPLFAWAVSRRRRRSGSDRTPARLTVVASTAYAGAVITTLVQALRGQPLFAPDATTIALAVALVAGPAAGGVIAMLRCAPGGEQWASEPCRQ